MLLPSNHRDIRLALTYCLTGLAVTLLAFSCAAQELEFAMSPTPVGSGARAAGMADAFVAVADDATAASWNPAGLVQLERPEISVVGSYLHLSEEFSADYHDEFDSTHRVNQNDLNYLSVAYPLQNLVLDRNVTIALNYQRKYDFSRNIKARYDVSRVFSGGIVLNEFPVWRFKQEGGLSTITPAIAFELTNRLSLGVAFNLWRSSFLSDNSWTQELQYEAFGFTSTDGRWQKTKVREEFEDFRGENLTFGALWTPVDSWSFGLRLDTAFTGEVDYSRTQDWTLLFLPVAGWRPGNVAALSRPAKEHRQIRFPQSLALGAAHRFGDRLTLSLDLTRTDWNEYWMKTASGARISLVDASNQANFLGHNHFAPTISARLGAEYVLVPKQPDETLDYLWTLRAGVYYDEESASKHPDGFWGATGGIGLLAFQRVNVDLAYQLRYGNGVNRDFIRGIRGFEEDVLQHRVLLSTVIYF